MLITFNTWLPDVAPEVMGANGLVDLENLRRLPGGGYGIAYGHTPKGEEFHLESRVCGSIICRTGTATYPNATFVGTEEGLWELRSNQEGFRGVGFYQGVGIAINSFVDQGGDPNLMRATTGVAHGYSQGDFVTIGRGVFAGKYNGTYEVQAVTAVDKFDFIHADDGADQGLVGDGYGLGTKKWDFCQFDTDVIGVTGHTVAPQNFAYPDPTNSFFDLDADAPYAYVCGTVGDQLVLGQVKARGAHAGAPLNLGAMHNAIWWSAKGDAAGWPQPGSATAIAQQSDYRILHGDGGKVQAIIGGEAVGYVFQEKTIWQMTYVGGATMFEIDPVEPERGVVARGCAVETPIGTVFLDSLGLYVLAADGAHPLGVGKFARHMMSELAGKFDEPGTMNMVADPRDTKIYLIQSGYSPAKTFVYDWAEDELTYMDEPLEWIGTVRMYGSGYQERDQIIAFDPTDHGLGRLDTIKDDGFLETGDIQPTPGRRSTLVKARPIMQEAAAVATLEVGARDTLDEAVSFGSAKSINAWNEYDCSEDGRYFRFQMNYTAGSGGLTGLELEFAPSGMY